MGIPLKMSGKSILRTVRLPQVLTIGPSVRYGSPKFLRKLPHDVIVNGTQIMFESSSE